MNPPKQLELLVIEDTLVHQESARTQFKEHRLTIAENYEDAKQLLMKPKYDSISEYNVVLTDLMMPKGSNDTMGPEGMKYILDLLPYGFPLAFLSAKKRVPYIGVVTDVNHHAHPMSACIDPLSNAYWNDKEAVTSLYTVNKSVVGIFHAPILGDGKNWQKVLDVLMSFQMEEK